MEHDSINNPRPSLTTIEKSPADSDLSHSGSNLNDFSLRDCIREKLGICQWFHYQDYFSVERAVNYLHDLRLQASSHRISWADYHRPGGEEWFRWMLEQLTDFEVLLSIWHTPPSIAEFPTALHHHLGSMILRASFGKSATSTMASSTH